MICKYRSYDQHIPHIWNKRLVIWRVYVIYILYIWHELHFLWMSNDLQDCIATILHYPHYIGERGGGAAAAVMVTALPRLRHRSCVASIRYRNSAMISLSKKLRYWDFQLWYWSFFNFNITSPWVPLSTWMIYRYRRIHRVSDLRYWYIGLLYPDIVVLATFERRYRRIFDIHLDSWQTPIDSWQTPISESKYPISIYPDIVPDIWYVFEGHCTRYRNIPDLG